jgi:mannose-6-phosphate isomerase-like protein (cupin superfamily)
MQVVRKPWGKECILINTDLYCAKIITCKDNLWSSGGKFHYHKKKDETFRVLRGRLELAVVNGDRVLTRFLTVNDERRVPPGTPHRFRSDNCKFLEVSTHDDPEDSYRVEIG